MHGSPIGYESYSAVYRQDNYSYAIVCCHLVTGILGQPIIYFFFKTYVYSFCHFDVSLTLLL